MNKNFVSCVLINVFCVAHAFAMLDSAQSAQKDVAGNPPAEVSPQLGRTSLLTQLLKGDGIKAPSTPVALMEPVVDDDSFSPAIKELKNLLGDGRAWQAFMQKINQMPRDLPQAKVTTIFKDMTSTQWRFFSFKIKTRSRDIFFEVSSVFNDDAITGYNVEVYPDEKSMVASYLRTKFMLFPPQWLSAEITQELKYCNVEENGVMQEIRKLFKVNAQAPAMAGIKEFVRNETAFLLVLQELSSHGVCVKSDDRVTVYCNMTNRAHNIFSFSVGNGDDDVCSFLVYPLNASETSQESMVYGVKSFVNRKVDTGYGDQVVVTAEAQLISAFVNKYPTLRFAPSEWFNEKLAGCENVLCILDTSRGHQRRPSDDLRAATYCARSSLARMSIRC